MSDNLDRKARSLALEELRQRKFADLDAIYKAMYDITQSDEAEDKDKVNAAKVCATMLGIARPAQEKSAPPSPTAADGTGAPPPPINADIEARIRKATGG